jgi:hypothetical protein
MLVLSAYVRAAVLADAVSSRGTIFHTVLIPSAWYRLAAFLILLTPVMSLSVLWRAVGWHTVNGYFIGFFTVLCGIATGAIALRVKPTIGGPVFP